MVRSLRAYQLLHQVRQDPLTVFTQAFAQGGLVPLAIGPWTVHLCAEPELFDEVLVEKASIFGKNTRGQRLLRVLLGEAMLTSEGTLWKKRRRLAQPAFRRPDLRLYATQMEASATAVLRGWKPGQAVDIAHQMMALTLEIATSCLFGEDLGRDAAEVESALAEVLEAYVWVISAPMPGIERLPVGPPAAYRRAIKRLRRVVMDLIARRRSGPQREDLLGVLLDSDLDDEALRDELVTMLLAAHETTANALTWTWTLLAKNPSARRRLQAEVEGVSVVDEALKRDGLPWTTAVFNESLRLFPPAWTTARAATEDTTLGGVPLKAGTQVMLPTYALHRSARHWRDAEGFDPERWIRGEKGPFMPFGAGQRKCIGSHFAMLEAKIVLGVLAQQRLELVPGTDLTPSPSVTLRPSGPVWMVPKG